MQAHIHELGKGTGRIADAGPSWELGDWVLSRIMTEDWICMATKGEAVI
jgi:hypothetical protein